jgi:hypothetical protein
MRWAGHAAHEWEKWNVYSILVGEPEGKVGNIKMDLKR